MLNIEIKYSLKNHHRRTENDTSNYKSSKTSSN